MKTCGLFLLCLLLATLSLASDLPYNEKADARMDLRQALSRAHAMNKKVLLVFGANWCPDCRQLDKAMFSAESSLNGQEFVIVKVDVGHFDRNIDLAENYGNPIRKGIPGAVILTAENRILFAGPLSRLVTPGGHIRKIMLPVAIIGSATVVFVGGGVFLRRRKFKIERGRTGPRAVEID